MYVGFAASKGWKSTSIWEHCKQMKSLFRMKLRADLNQGMLTVIRSSSLLSRNLKIKIYRTIILPVVLYGYETWSLTLREERRLWVLRKGC